jgi:hypothetical protein
MDLTSTYKLINHVSNEWTMSSINKNSIDIWGSENRLPDSFKLKLILLTLPFGAIKITRAAALWHTNYMEQGVFEKLIVD